MVIASLITGVQHKTAFPEKEQRMGMMVKWVKSAILSPTLKQLSSNAVRYHLCYHKFPQLSHKEVEWREGGGWSWPFVLLTVCRVGKVFI